MQLQHTNAIEHTKNGNPVAPADTLLTMPIGKNSQQRPCAPA